MSTKSELEAAYRATLYRVFLPSGLVELRVDQLAPTLATWLREEDIEQWALLTAFNPAWQRLGDAENRERQSALEVTLLEKGYEPFAGENIADQADWPPEETCLVPNISLAEALLIARQYDQNAILYGTAEGVARLVWVEN